MASYPLTVFFDGACPICDREIALMRRLDRHRRLLLCDFSRPDYDPTSINISPAELGRIIHARWGDGTVITGVDVFRAMWEAVGLGFLARLTRLALIEPLVVNAYAWFARNRLRLTGRSHGCSGGVCDSRQFGERHHEGKGDVLLFSERRQTAQAKSVRCLERLKAGFLYDSRSAT
jgi:predicted DCC family thiol-disulfide oxidoreductase YuxK